MNYALVQIKKNDYMSYSIGDTVPFFMIVLTGMTLDQAMLERSKTENPDWYVIIQIW